MKLVPKKRCLKPPAPPQPPKVITSRQALASLCEHALMGECVPVSVEWVDQMTYYLLGVLSANRAPGEFSRFSESAGFSVLNDRIRKYDPKRLVTHIYTCTVYGNPCIGYVLKGKDITNPFTEDYGSGYPCATCYVFNPIWDDQCSEMGDCFFEKRADGMYHRVS